MTKKYWETFKREAIKPCDDPSVFENIIDELHDPLADHLVDTKKAANILGLTEGALRIMVYRGKVPTFRLGRRLRFKLRDLHALIDDFLEYA